MLGISVVPTPWHRLGHDPCVPQRIAYTLTAVSMKDTAAHSVCHVRSAIPDAVILLGAAYVSKPMYLSLGICISGLLGAT